jgi:hypothetical protein
MAEFDMLITSVKNIALKKKGTKFLLPALTCSKNEPKLDGITIDSSGKDINVKNIKAIISCLLLFKNGFINSIIFVVELIGWITYD